MNPNESTKVILAAGGDAAFAKMIGLDPAAKGICQRVNNWKRRGIPASVVLENLKIIRQLEKLCPSEKIPTKPSRKAA